MPDSSCFKGDSGDALCIVEFPILSLDDESLLLVRIGPPTIKLQS